MNHSSDTCASYRKLARINLCVCRKQIGERYLWSREFLSPKWIENHRQSQTVVFRVSNLSMKRQEHSLCMSAVYYVESQT